MNPSPKYRRGWFVTTTTGLKGKVEDVFIGAKGWEYTLVISGAMNVRMTFPESVLLREGFTNIKNKKGGH